MSKKKTTNEIDPRFIADSVDDVTMDTKFLKLAVLGNNNEVVTIDIQRLMKAPIHSEDAWIEVTPILKAYNKEIGKWLRNSKVQEYINLINDEIFNVANCNIENTTKNDKPTNCHFINTTKNDENDKPTNCRFINTTKKQAFKAPFVKSQWFLKSKYDWLNNDCPLICTRRGKNVAGTYLHKELFLEFIGTLDVKIRRQMHKLIMNVIAKSDTLKEERAGTILKFHPLTDVIKDLYVPMQKEGAGKSMAYANLMNILNKKVLGVVASVYRKSHNLEKGSLIRHTLNEIDLKEIMRLEEVLFYHIKYGKITNYHKLKELINNEPPHK